MTLFYEEAIKDDMIGHFFINELGEDIEDEEWIEHIELLADFWLAKLLGEDTYYGNFIGAHVKMPHIQKENYTRWVELFRIAADKVYEPKLAQLFKEKGLEFSKMFLTSEKKI